MKPESSATLTALQIGMTASTRHLSGTDRYFLDLARELPAHGVDVRGVVLGAPETLAEPVPGVAGFAPEGASRWRRWSGVRTAVRRSLGASDLVVSHGAAHAFPALDLFGRRPLVAHFHGPWALEGAAEGLGRARVAIRRVQERAVYARAQRFIVLSRAFGTILRDEYGVAESRIRVVPGGVDVERFAPRVARDEARRRLGWPREPFVAATIRRLVATKGLEDALDATAEVRATHPHFELAMVGTGPLADALRRRAERLRLGDGVRFPGHVDEARLPLVYRAADLIVVPTVALEGFGLTVLEALACGTPVLVTPVGGLPEVVEPFRPELVLESPGAGPLARALSAIVEGRIALPTAAQCRAYAEGFAWARIARRVRDVYAEQLACA
jgi:glycosyltransferase involved in cell wall biosynthesis